MDKQQWGAGLADNGFETPDVFVERLEIADILSFGVVGICCELGPLNVLVGPNGSGKSNLIETVDLLKSLPKDLAGMARQAGGIQDLLHKGDPQAQPEIRALFHLGPDLPVRYKLRLAAVQHRLEIIDERIESARESSPKHVKPYLFYGYENGRPMLNVGKKKRRLRREDVAPDQSILAQRKDRESYPELTNLGELLSQIRIYRNWTFGRVAPARQPQQADLPSDVLMEDFSNLALVLNEFKLTPKLRDSLMSRVHSFSGQFLDFTTKISGNQVQLYLQDNEWSVPAHRLSDGTIRYLCLLAILMNPHPPPLVCIEEPELGMHPNVLPDLARLLLEASEKTQLIVTTHSDILVDALSHTPECLLLAENTDVGTRFLRRGSEELKVWLSDFGLGQLWLRGELG